MFTGSCTSPPPVSDVKPIIKADLIASHHADAYSEPDQKVMSRSGNECVVALVDQWYLKYGEAAWQSEVKQHVQEKLQVSRRICRHVLRWMLLWGCNAAPVCTCVYMPPADLQPRRQA